jgi:hypothetical protein
MDEILYSSLSSYFNALEYKGYMSYTQAQKLLILAFYRDFVFNDYRGLINKEDYHQIESALDCLYGSTCLIPYPDYLKMGKLHLGDTTELASRVKTLEQTKVLKAEDLTGGSYGSDIVIISEEEE